MKKIIGIVVLAIFMFGLVGCEYQPTTEQKTSRIIEENQQKLMEVQPIPTLEKSLERQNLIARAKLLNDENKVFYVYLISYGKVMAFFTTQTKVSSLNSYLNPQEKVILSSNGPVTVDSADIDGSYGENADGVFFFTTEGAYVEWKGEYMASDYPLKLSTPPELIKVME